MKKGLTKNEWTEGTAINHPNIENAVYLSPDDSGIHPILISPNTISQPKDGDRVEISETPHGSHGILIQWRPRSMVPTLDNETLTRIIMEMSSDIRSLTDAVRKHLKASGPKSDSRK